jgi:3-hydroxyisobutyrate dehydrogenase-like beta-hydroxyacid dehydrogenase
MSGDMKIAFLGIGLMGFPMARNLLQARFHVTVWNRAAGKAGALAAFGGIVAHSASHAVQGADCVIAMLSDGKAVSDVLHAQGVAAAMSPGALFIDMSSIKPAEAKAHAAHLAGLGVEALDAPVSGGTKGADLATLAIMAGGNEAVFERAVPVFKAMGRPTYVGTAGCGQIAKLANQGIVAITIGAVAEAILLAQKAGLAKGALRAALAGGFADSVIFQQHGQRMEDQNFVPGGRSAFQLKDLNNLLEAASDHGVSLPLADIQRQRFQDLVAELDGGDLDHSALYLKLLDEQ